MPLSQKKVLVVDDEPHVRTTIREVLLDEKYLVMESENAVDAMRMLSQQQFDVVLMDIKMPGESGMDALRKIRERCPDTGIIMISGHDSIDSAVESIKLGAHDFLQKPFSIQRLRDAVRNLACRPDQAGPEHAPGTGGRFGAYELRREIAAGATACVYEAVQTAHNRKVALKILHKHLAGDQTFLARFEQEAKIAASLSHPNIVSVYEYGTVRDRPYIAMEYVDGFSLEHMVLKLKTVPSGAAASVAVKVCDALEYAHRNNVLHRDVKPGNILVSGSGEVKVTDFGFSRLLDSASTRLTLHNRVVGTPLYMSPEQIEGGDVSYSTDVFSLGIVLYFLVTGAPPFGGDSAMGVMKKILECDYPRPRKINRKVARELEGIIMKCLQRDRSVRYGSMADFKGALAEFLAGVRIDSLEKEIGAFVNMFIKDGL
jgi:serine/threonine protein kinase